MKHRYRCSGAERRRYVTHRRREHTVAPQEEERKDEHDSNRVNDLAIPQRAAAAGAAALLAVGVLFRPRGRVEGWERRPEG